jgi:hypothetical protein
VRNALIRFRRMTPWRLVSDLRRAARLKRADPRRRAPHARDERLVVTLTTIPERGAALIPTLRSLLDQTWPADRIVIAWPEATRSGKPYPAPPPLPEGVDLLACQDEGPATKLLPTLKAEPDAVLVVVDDDVIYPVDFLETLLRAHRAERKAALGLRGHGTSRAVDPRDIDHIFATAVAAPTAVDVLMGTWGYLVPPGSLDDAVHDFSNWPPELRWVDDYWISGHLARRGVPRRVVPAKGLPRETRMAKIGGLQLAPNPDGRNNRIGIEAFAAWW